VHLVGATGPESSRDGDPVTAAGLTPAGEFEQVRAAPARARLN
jgi:hypothetical protein